jgi:Secretion system C-terminal sorting domain
MKNNSMFKLLFLLLFPMGLKSQSVFAPVKGAIWNYYFDNANVERPTPGFRFYEGIVTITYVKDTVINNINFKKLEQFEKFKYRGNDTLFTSKLRDLFFTQRNDTVFVREYDTLAIAFVYKTTIGSVTALKSTYRLDFSLELKDTLNVINNNVKYKKFLYKTNTKAVDVDFVNPLVILERFGPENCDIWVIDSHLRLYNPNSYKLNCYSDSEVGEVKFSDRKCNSTTSVEDISRQMLHDFQAYWSNDRIIINVNDNADEIGKIKIFDTTGKLIMSNTPQLIDDKTLSLQLQPLNMGIYLIQLESKKYNYQSHKLFIY